MMSLLRFKRRQSELHRVHGLPEGCATTSNEHFNSPQSIRSRFWGGVGASAGAIIGGFGWMVIVAIRLQTWWLAGLVVLLIGLLLIRTVNFFALNPSIPQSRIFQHMQAICRDLGVVQCLLLISLFKPKAPSKAILFGSSWPSSRHFALGFISRWDIRPKVRGETSKPRASGLY